MRLAVDARTREQLVQALLGLTETEIENALAKAAIALRGIGPAAVPLVLEEKRGVIRRSGALAYTHPEPADHLGGYAHLRAPAAGGGGHLHPRGAGLRRRAVQGPAAGGAARHAART